MTFDGLLPPKSRISIFLSCFYFCCRLHVYYYIFSVFWLSSCFLCMFSLGFPHVVEIRYEGSEVLEMSQIFFYPEICPETWDLGSFVPEMSWNFMWILRFSPKFSLYKIYRKTRWLWTAGWLRTAIIIYKTGVIKATYVHLSAAFWVLLC